MRAPGVAVKSWVVSPAEECFCPEAIYFPEDLARVTGYAAHSHPAQELDRLVPHRFTRGPTIVSELNDAILCGGNLYAGRFKHAMRETRKLVASISDELPDAGVPCTSRFGDKYFGHWLAEDTPLKMLVESYGSATELAAPLTAHQESYNSLFGIQRRLLPDDCIVRKAVIVESELCSRFRDMGWQLMKEKIDVTYPAKPHIGCMLLRGASGSKRLLLNEEEIAERLKSLGFRIVDPARDPLDAILRATSGSRIIAGVEGSHLAHGLHCLGEGCAMVSLQPPNRLGCIDKDRCDRKKVRYALSVGHQETDGFRIDIDRLLRLLDRVIYKLKAFSTAGLP